MPLLPLTTTKKNQLVHRVPPLMELKKVPQDAPNTRPPRRSRMLLSRSRSSCSPSRPREPVPIPRTDKFRPHSSLQQPHGQQKGQAASSLQQGTISFVPADECCVENPLRDTALPTKIDVPHPPPPSSSLEWNDDDEKDKENDAVSEVTLDDWFRTKPLHDMSLESLQQQSSSHDLLWAKLFHPKFFGMSSSSYQAEQEECSRPEGEDDDEEEGQDTSVLYRVQSNEEWGMTSTPIEGEAGTHHPWILPLNGLWPSDEDMSPIKKKKRAPVRQTRPEEEGKEELEVSTEVQIHQLSVSSPPRLSYSFEI